MVYLTKLLNSLWIRWPFIIQECRVIQKHSLGTSHHIHTIAHSNIQMDMKNVVDTNTVTGRLSIKHAHLKTFTDMRFILIMV